jgi:hypothetical protein
VDNLIAQTRDMKSHDHEMTSSPAWKTFSCKRTNHGTVSTQAQEINDGRRVPQVPRDTARTSSWGSGDALPRGIKPEAKTQFVKGLSLVFTKQQR